MTMPRKAARAGAATVLTAGLLALGGGDPALASPGLAVPKGATIVIHGRGYGHGHGMSQYGAQGAAKQGRTTRQILAFYYPHTSTGRVDGSVRVLITENIGAPTTVVARPGLQVRDLARHTTYRVPGSGAPSRATLWKMAGASGGGTRVLYRTGSWHLWRTLSGNGEFRSSGAALTLVLPQGRVTYHGTLRSMAPISRTTHRITVNRVSLEDYVKGVVPREMPSTWRGAALRAQAVAARTYAAWDVGNSYDPRFNLGDSTTWQVYGGKSAQVASTDRAVAATAGEVRTYQGKPAFTQFSASNGGEVAANGQPYLVAEQDPYDTGAVDPYASWRVRVTAARIQRAWPRLGTLTSIEVTARDGAGKWGGRISTLVLHGTQGDKSLTGAALEAKLGLRSTYLTFTIASSKTSHSG